MSLIITDGFGPATGGGGGGGPGITPSIGNFSPAVGAAVTSTTAISFDVTDDTGVFRRILLAVNFAGAGIYEIAHDGDSFGPQYAGTGNGMVSIVGGYRFTLLRVGGWPASPLLRVFAIDLEGLEA